MQQYNLICTDEVWIGAIGSVFFAGWAGLALILPPRADKVGRRVISMTSLFISASMVVTLLVSNSIYMLLLASLTMGLMSTGRIAVTYVYMMEFLTPEWRT